MTPADQPTIDGPLGVPEAGMAIEGILDRIDADTEEAPEAPLEKAPKRAKAEPEPETPEEDEQSDPEGPEEAPMEEEEPTEETQPPLYTVKVDGKEEQVTLEELQRGYSGQKWVTTNLQTLAQQRKSLEAEQKAVSEERAQYAQYLGQLKTQLDQGGEQEPDWEKLRAEDEFKFVVERQAWMLKQERRAAVQQEIQRTQARQKQDSEQALQRQLAEGRQKLLEAIPAWKDSKKFEDGKAAVRDYAKSIGFTDEEIAQTYDPRAVLALHKAAQFDKLAKAQVRPVQNRSPQSARPGASEVSPGRPAELTRIRQRLAKSGSVEDAAAFFEQSGVAG